MAKRPEWKTSSGNLERRFRRFDEVHCPERAKLLDISVEECSFVEQAPPSKLLGTWLQQHEQEHSKPDEAGGPHYDAAKRWYGRVLRLYARIRGPMAKSRQKAERRDKGMAREFLPDRETEAGFGRKRAAAVDALVAASPSKRRRIIAEAAPDLAALARGTAQGSGDDPFIAAATVVDAVAKREGKARERYLGGAKAAAKARSTREKKVFGSRDADLATARRPGLMLVCARWHEACRKAQRLHFRVIHDPVDFLNCVAKQETTAAGRRGNVVLVETADSATDFGIAAKIAAAFTGAFFTTPTDFVRQDSPEGIQYTEKLRSSRKKYYLAATANLQTHLPTLPLLLRALAQTPSGCVTFYLTPKKLCKWVKTQGKGVLHRACVLSRLGEEQIAKKSWKHLYISPNTWILRCNASVVARCPGT